MRVTIQYLNLFLFFALVVGFSSCVKEDYANKETATVNLVFSTRVPDGGSTTENTAPIDENEGIKTLRVFITDASGNVEINAYREYDDNAASKTLVIQGVPVGTTHFYVIANEASVGLVKTELDAKTKVDAAFLDQVITNPAAGTYFPKTRSQINDFGLPITGMKENVNISADNNDPINIYIKHAVAKVVLNITNLMTEDFSIQNVNVGPFIADATYLFPDRSGYQIGEKGLRTQTFSTTTSGVQVNTGENPAVFVFYTYETGKGASATDFTIDLDSPTVPEINAKPFFTDRNYIDRNEQVVIDATVNIKHNVTITLRYEVQPWASVPVTVPPFN